MEIIVPSVLEIGLELDGNESSHTIIKERAIIQRRLSKAFQ